MKRLALRAKNRLREHGRGAALAAFLSAFAEQGRGVVIDRAGIGRAWSLPRNGHSPFKGL